MKTWKRYGMTHEEFKRIGDYSLVNVTYSDEPESEPYAVAVFKTKGTHFCVNYSTFRDPNKYNDCVERATQYICKQMDRRKTDKRVKS